MQKLYAILALMFSLCLVHQVANANPRHYGGPNDYKRDATGYRFQNLANENNDDDSMQQRRREREQRGLRRLQQHKWQAGYVMPQHYRSDSYKVDYRGTNLPKPARNQQWYKVNNDYILVDSETNNIIQIMEY
ncbi:RcnB family protein [Acinetobacter larvae]|uniref:RcnB family protein n=1 Tax=Acinetobacter larvae TaxID=1789224 RepID=A0A1B2LW37_9GAMM|nr:RcnB family protein [Acinetobacter larvae]AOA56973.1 hypothetical protein BFG52_00440 [Acinetobacter larvae]